MINFKQIIIINIVTFLRQRLFPVNVICNCVVSVQGRYFKPLKFPKVCVNLNKHRELIKKGFDDLAVYLPELLSSALQSRYHFLPSEKKCSRLRTNCSLGVIYHAKINSRPFYSWVNLVIINSGGPLAFIAETPWVPSAEGLVTNALSNPGL